MQKKSYLCIDLKSFYASVECKEQDFDPMTTNLVVADKSRTEKTICLAVSPSLKAYGIPGRPRLFEVVQRVEKINQERRKKAPGHQFTGSSCDAKKLGECPELKLDYVCFRWLRQIRQRQRNTKKRHRRRADHPILTILNGKTYRCS